MAKVNWQEVLGWNQAELEDLRFVGYSYIKQGQYDIALTFFEALVVLSPHSAYDLQTLGALYLQKGNNLMALNFLERALKIDATNLPTQLNRVKALYALGYRKQAATHAKALSSCPDKTTCDQASALLLAYS